MSQSQFPYNTFQANPQSQIYNINPNQDVAYTQQQAYPAATQFQYSINNQETVMMQMNPFQQSFNNIITSVNQNQTKVKKDDKDIQNIMPNKQENPKLPKQSPPMKLTNEINNRSNSVKSKTSAKNKAAEKSIDEIKLKLDSISTALPSDPLDLERNSGVPDFIKKLYRLLEDQGYQSLISWGENGDTFVVKDQTEFSRKVLPKHFKHNNFASFVRQLNKYDFHKVKVDKTNSFGENIWEFKHPYFQFNRKDQLELIKRKISNKNPKPTEQKQSNLSPDIQQQVNNLIEIGSALASNVGQLTTNYSDFSKDYINFGKYMELQSKTLKSLVDFVIDKELRKQPNPTKNNNNFENLLNTYNYWNSNTQVIQDNFTKFQNSVTKNIEQMKITRDKINSLNERLKSSLSSVKMDDKITTEENIAIENILKSNKNANKESKNNTVSGLVNTDNTMAINLNANNPVLINNTTDINNTMNLDINTTTQLKTSPPTQTIPMPLLSSDLKATTSIIKSVKKPKWSQPPRVLLVEDDAICRALSSKLLKVFGCKIDVAVDGQSAIERMGDKKYDIVLMDIVMPKIDGVTATNRIRQFDQLTPIISMTSNTTENDCITYFNNGMNDVLPKPFNKNGLLSVLERYCSHLRHMNENAMDPGFSKTIMMIGSNNDNSNASLFGLNWNNVETSKGRITELQDDDVSTSTNSNSSTNNNNNTNNTNSTTLQNTTAPVNTTSSINMGQVLSTTTNPVLLSMYDKPSSSTATTIAPSLNSMMIQNFNVSMQQPMPITDTQNVNVQYFSTIPDSTTIITQQNTLQPTNPQILTNNTTDPNLLPNQILINNIVLPSNQAAAAAAAFIPNDPNSLLGKPKNENDIRLINETIST